MSGELVSEIRAPRRGPTGTLSPCSENLTRIIIVTKYLGLVTRLIIL
jgi:hypothetical protein